MGGGKSNKIQTRNVCVQESNENFKKLHWFNVIQLKLNREYCSNSKIDTKIFIKIYKWHYEQFFQKQIRENQTQFEWLPDIKMSIKVTWHKNVHQGNQLEKDFFFHKWCSNNWIFIWEEKALTSTSHHTQKLIGDGS